MDQEFSRMKLSLSSRLALAGGLFAAGALLQVLLRWGLVPGVVAIIVGYIPLGLKKITNKPADQGLEEWRAVSMAEIDKLADTLRESKAALGRSAGQIGLMIALTAVTLVLAGGFLAVNPDISLVIADGLLFSIPAMFFGRVKVFVPHTLSLKMPCFQAVFAEKSSDSLVMTPYLRFDKDKEGHDVPEDMRLMVEPKRKPADFVGVQMQAAINKGPRGEVPYLYAVILTEGKGESFKKLKSLDLEGYEVESGGDEKYGSIVIRQSTSGEGYFTKPSDCVDLYQVVRETLNSQHQS